MLNRILNTLPILTLFMLLFVLCMSAAFAQDERPAIPFYDTAVEVSPRMPIEGESVAITLRGVLPSTRYSLIAPDAPVYEEISFENMTQIILPFRVVETSEAGLEVLTDAEERVVINGLKSYPYELIVTVNGFEVNRQLLTILPEGSERPFDPRILRAEAAIEPERPRPNEPISFYIEGYFPTAGFVVSATSLGILESFPEQIVLNMDVIEPDGPVAQVVTPFREYIGTATLTEAIRPLRVRINGEIVTELDFVVGDPPIGKEPIVPGASIQIEPERPVAGQPFSVYFIAKASEESVPFETLSLVTTRSMPAQIIANIELSADADPQSAEEGYLKQLIGTATLPAGIHPLFASLNGEEFFRQDVIVYDPARPEAWVVFRRSGGFAGWSHSMTMDHTGSVEIETTANGDDPDLGGLIPEELLYEIEDMMRSIEPEELQAEYHSDVTIADGYVYDMNLNGRRVFLEQEAEAPEALWQLVHELERIATGQVELSGADREVTTVQDWINH